MFGIFKDKIIIVLDTINLKKNQILKKLKYYEKVMIFRHKQFSDW